jgi:two-component system response regulator AlgR
MRTHIEDFSRGNRRKVPLADISHCIADSKWVEVHAPGVVLLIEQSLTSLEAEFPDKFVRLHRNCIASRDHVERVFMRNGAARAELRGVSLVLSVSRRQAPTVRRMLRERRTKA